VSAGLDVAINRHHQLGGLIHDYPQVAGLLQGFWHQTRSSAQPINAAFARGDVERALSLTTDEIGDRLSIADTPEEVAKRVRTVKGATSRSRL
jgi:alkanesulfonate monooxygenase SsuD/methylene tetrahydromethanopterin reductase-like flavin-dependent oxidoreductase (luciferase family)